MSNKNPFEIRADILHLAKEYMDEQMRLNIKFSEKMQEIGMATVQDLQKAYSGYSMEELTKKAQEMYSFISKKE